MDLLKSLIKTKKVEINGQKITSEKEELTKQKETYNNDQQELEKIKLKKREMGESLIVGIKKDLEAKSSEIKVRLITRV